jgi:8-oxo-dGTP diphosphatase
MKTLQVAVGVVKNAEGRILISLRHPSLHQGGLWEFPGGKIEPGETAEQALHRELKEELDITVVKATPLIGINHLYPDRSVQLHVFLVEHFWGKARHAHNQAIEWVEPAQLSNFSFPSANRPIITAARLPPHYAIWDDADPAKLLLNLQQILAKGVKLIQARLKSLPAEQALRIIEEAYPLCRQHDAVLLINSAAAEIDQSYTQECKDLREGVIGDGIHLTAAHLMSLQQRPKQHPWVAASCHNLVELRHAQRINVDFAILAPVLPTQTHPEAKPLGWERFAEWVCEVNIPVYALGGMTESHLDLARQSGAQGIAGIRAFLGQ